MSACMAITTNGKQVFVNDPTKLSKVMTATAENAMFKNPVALGAAAAVLISFALTAAGQGKIVAGLWTLLLLVALGYGAYKVTVVNAKIITDNTSDKCNVTQGAGVAQSA